MARLYDKYPTVSFFLPRFDPLACGNHLLIYYYNNGLVHYT